MVALVAGGALTPAGGALLTGGLQFLGGMLNYGAKKQDYANQVAFQDATSEFNSWQATQNAEIQDLNSDYQYFAETVQYNNTLAQSQQEW